MANHVVVQTVILTSLISAVTFFATLFYRKWKQQRIPSTWTHIGQITKMKLYPLKSGRRIDIKAAECTEVGLQEILTTEKRTFRLRDRCLMVYGEKDLEFRTARTYPKLILISVTVHDDEHLAIDAPTMPKLLVKIPKDTRNRVKWIKCWKGERIRGIDCGDEVATWLSRYLIESDIGFRLAYHDVGERRDITKTHQKILNYYKNLDNDGTGLYSDLSSLSIMNQQSVNDMNRRITDDSVIDEENFRANLVVDGPNLQPYVEDDWDFIKIGEDVVLRNVKECTRCIETMIDENGIRNPTKNPLKTLRTYRMNNNPDNSPVLGLHLGVQKTGLIKVGDPVYIGKLE